MAAIDLARALAVLGMVVLNFCWMLEPEDMPAPLEFVGDHLAGHFAALFVLVSGVAISLASRGMSRGTLRRRLGRRALALAALGFALTALWPSDILHFYALYLLVAIAVLDASSATLLAIAGVLVAGSFGLNLMFDHDVGWDWSDDPGYASLFQPALLLRHLLFNGLHSLFPWGAFLLIGMVVGRRDLGAPRLHQNLGLAGLWLMVLGDSSSMLIAASVDPFSAPQWLVDMGAVYPWPSRLPFVASGLGFSLIALAVACHVERAWKKAALLDPVQALGRAALSLYVLHAVGGVIVLSRSDLFVVATTRDVVICSALFIGPALVLATWWDGRHGGPLERLLRAWSTGRAATRARPRVRTRTTTLPSVSTGA